jgi:tRNA(Leu) C34 or U34 (ribose-2'-O)-methylase TrmL
VTRAGDDDGLFIWRRGQEFHQAAPLEPAVPAVVLTQPKFPHNLGQTIRLASCYGVGQVWFSGRRVAIKAEPGFRLPREERMRGYADVTLVNDPDPLTAILRAQPDAVPVAVELRPGAEDLRHFQHPEKAVYVFGPEDGSLGGPILKRCHRFVVIPSRHCLNLATSVGTVLYDRARFFGTELSVAGEQRRA